MHEFSSHNSIENKIIKKPTKNIYLTTTKTVKLNKSIISIVGS